MAERSRLASRQIGIGDRFPQLAVAQRECSWINRRTSCFFLTTSFWVLAIGLIVPVAGYLFNRMPAYHGLSEWVKGLGQVVLTATVGGLYSALAQDISGVDNVAQHCFSAVIASLYAHKRERQARRAAESDADAEDAERDF